MEKTDKNLAFFDEITRNPPVLFSQREDSPGEFVIAESGRFHRRVLIEIVPGAAGWKIADYFARDVLREEIPPEEKLIGISLEFGGEGEFAREIISLREIIREKIREDRDGQESCRKIKEEKGEESRRFRYRPEGESYSAAVSLQLAEIRLGALADEISVLEPARDFLGELLVFFEGDPGGRGNS